MIKHLLIAVLVLASFHVYAGGKRDTLRIAGTDSMIIRKYDKKNRVKETQFYKKDLMVSFRLHYYTDSTYGYEEFNLENDTTYQREFYSNGQRRIAGMKVKSKQEGPYLTWFSNGNAQCICNFSGGKREGMQTVNHENGQLYFTINFTAGEKNGSGVQYYDNGQPEVKGRFVNGYEQDTFYYYYRDGSLWTTIVFRNGQPYNVLVNNDPAGKPQDKGTLKDGTGTRNVYDEKGKLVEIEEYNKGKAMRSRKVK